MVRALRCVQDGDVSGEELGKIMNHLKRACANKKLLARVEAKPPPLPAGVAGVQNEDCRRSK